MPKPCLLRLRADYGTTGNVAFQEQIEENCLLDTGIHDPYLVCRSNDETCNHRWHLRSLEGHLVLVLATDCCCFLNITGFF